MPTMPSKTFTPTSRPVALSLDPASNGQVAIIRLNMPERLNALGFDGYVKLAQCFDEVAQMESVIVTVLTGTGRYFSAGADYNDVSRPPPDTSDVAEAKKHWTSRFANGNMTLTKAIQSHPKLIVGAMNGPAVGLSAALLGLVDFLYVLPHFFLFTPFMTLGLVAEGGSSVSFVRRMGVSKAKEALLEGRKMDAEELERCGFVNRIYPSSPTNDILTPVLAHVRATFLPPQANAVSLLTTKRLIDQALDESRTADEANFVEVTTAVQRALSGDLTREFEALRAGRKKHKL